MYNKQHECIIKMTKKYDLLVNSLELSHYILPFIFKFVKRTCKSACQ